jgi:DNA-binding transcriptional LysR family regulator
MDHLQAIRIFTRVVETGGFNRAAESLDMPNATVSKWVKSLEVHLGVTLLERSTRSVSVTTDGAAYYDRTRHLLMELDDIESTLGRSKGNPRGMLRVDTGGTTASGILIPHLPAFQARYPDIEIRLSVTDRNSDLIAQNIDCAIRSSGDDPNVISHQIGTLDWTMCASPAFFEKYKKPVHPNDITAHTLPVVGYFSATTGQMQAIRFKRAGEEITLEGLRNDVAVSESNAHLATALNGLGLINTLDFMVRPAIEKGDLVAVLPEWRPDPMPVYIAYPPSRRYNTKVRVFIDWVSTLFAATSR